MSRVAPLALILALLLSAPPAAAQTGEDPDVLQPCANPQGLEVLTLDGLQTTVDTPQLPLYEETTERPVILDLAGQPLDDDRAFVTAVMSWDIPVEDYDLFLFDASGNQLAASQGVQPIDGDTETVSGGFDHCDRFVLAARNWTAAGLSTLSLDVTASPSQF